MKLKKVMGVVAAAAMALSLTACGAVDIASIGLPETLDMEKGESTQLEIAYDAGDASAEAIAEAAEKLELVWASSDEAVAVVDEEGNVTAVEAGEADITVSVKDGNLTSTCKVTVTVPIEGVETPESLELVIGKTDSAELNAKLLPEGATGATLTYESSDEAVATVDENGVVTAVGNGECVITTTATAEVQAEEPVAESEPASSSDVASTAAVSASADVSDSASASTSEAADADEAAPAEDVQTWTAETKVIVTTAPTGITLSSSGGKLYVGNTANVSVYTSPAEAAAAVASEVKYTSSDESVATVVGTTEGNAGFTVKGVSAGSATITVEYNGLKAEYSVTVTKYVAPSKGSNTSNGSTGGTAAGGSSGGTVTPTQPSGGGTTPTPPSGGGTTPTPPPSQPDTAPSGGAAGGNINDVIPGGGDFGSDMGTGGTIIDR